VAVYLVLGAAVSTIVMMALINLLTPWDMPALTAPFVLTAWLLLFAVYQFGHLEPTELIAPATLHPGAAVQTDLRELATGSGGLTAANLAHGLFRGVGEVMFEDNLLTGVIFLVAILVNSRISAAFAVLGSVVALLTALALGANGFLIYHGLYGFNAVLCAIALGGLFFVLTWRSAVYALLAAAFSVAAFAGIAVFLSPIGMPALTAPFVLTTWLFLWPKAGFRALEPVALADVTTAENIRATYRARAAGPSATAEPGEAP
jgi:urea transporter